MQVKPTNREAKVNPSLISPLPSSFSLSVLEALLDQINFFFASTKPLFHYVGIDNDKEPCAKDARTGQIDKGGIARGRREAEGNRRKSYQGCEDLGLTDEKTGEHGGRDIIRWEKKRVKRRWLSHPGRVSRKTHSQAPKGTKRVIQYYRCQDKRINGV